MMRYPRRSASAVEPGSRPRRNSLSHASSFSMPRNVPSAHKANSVASASAAAEAVGETPDPTPRASLGASATRPGPASFIDYGPQLGYLNTDARINTSTRSRFTSPHSDISRVKPRANSCSASMRSPTCGAPVERWEGQQRTASAWDGLRRDPELWLDDGDCLVHLYARGQSRRGPSFCVPFAALKQAQCGSMFSLCFAQFTTTTGPANTPRRVAGLDTQTAGSKVELYIPAPEDVSREAAFNWHLTTRNFFAFVFGKPLVGTHMGQALVDLQERMHLFRSGQINNNQDFLNYTDAQGYRDFVDHPAYALASLYYAEHYKLREVWIDAFAHCVGMNESLSSSTEFASLSPLTKALITRAYLEMDIQLGRVTAALRNFLEDDVSPAYLGLTEGARTHVDRFRTFLHGFYVEKFGYWPPPKGSAFSKSLLRSLYFDFQNLYDYLVDSESTADISLQKPASGGICVLQNVGSFDKRHNFPALPHPLPLIPQDVSMRKRTESQKGLRTLTLGSKQAQADRHISARAALSAATNNKKISVTSSPIVQAYTRFERQHTASQRDEKVSTADARKVRWLLIYGTLQYLISALRAPKEVRDNEKPSYPLCCLVTEQSPWQAGTKVLTAPLTRSINVPAAIDDYLEFAGSPSEQHLSATPKTLVEPDCQKGDYFTHTNTDEEGHSLVEVPAPLRIAQFARISSTCSFRRRSNVSRKNSVQLKPTAHCEILVHGYGNGLNTTTSRSVSQAPSQASSRRQSFSFSYYETSSESTLSLGSGASTPVCSSDRGRPQHLDLDCNVATDGTQTPMVDSARMDVLVSPVTSTSLLRLTSSADSTTSADSPFWSDEASSASTRSSIYSQPSVMGSHPLERTTMRAQQSGVLGGLVSFDGAPIAQSKETLVESRPISVAASSIYSDFNFDFNSQSSPLNDALHGSPTTSDMDSAIGMAFSAPPTPVKQARPASNMVSTSGDKFAFAAPKKSHTHSRSMSSESLRALTIEADRVAKMVESMSPLRSTAPSVTTSNDVDIFSTLDMSSFSTELGMSESTLKLETPSMLTYLYSTSGMQTMPYTATKGLPVTVVSSLTEEHRGRRTSTTRRKSFWRR